MSEIQAFLAFTVVVGVLCFGIGYLLACSQWRNACPECERRFQARLDEAGRSEPW